MASVLRAHLGEEGVIEPTYVHLDGISGGEALRKQVDGLPYFSVQIELGVRDLAASNY